MQSWPWHLLCRNVNVDGMALVYIMWTVTVQVHLCIWCIWYWIKYNVYCSLCSKLMTFCSSYRIALSNYATHYILNLVIKDLIRLVTEEELQYVSLDNVEIAHVYVPWGFTCLICFPPFESGFWVAISPRMMLLIVGMLSKNVMR